MKKIHLVFVLCGAALSSFLPANADTFKLTLISGGNTISITDGDANDFDPWVGQIGFSGTFGGFSGTVQALARVGYNGWLLSQLTGNLEFVSDGSFQSYLYFGDFGPLNPDANIIESRISADFSDGVNLWQSAYENPDEADTTGSTGSLLTSQGGTGDIWFSGISESTFEWPFNSVGQLVDFGVHKAGTTASFGSSVVAKVPDASSTFRLLFASAMMFVSLASFKRLRRV